MPDTPTDPQRTPLHSLHRELGARMGEFAGYDLPIRYEPGIIAEHQHTRRAASLFDVSHMGQVEVHGPGRVAWLERLVPADLAIAKPGRIRYTFFTLPGGGVLDDLLVTNADDHLALVVNAGRKDVDLAHLESHREPGVEIRYRPDLALLAIQGPAAVDALAAHVSDVRDMAFMTAARRRFDGIPVTVTRSGYTGEDGFEISVANEQAEPLARALLDHPAVEPAGLGARDSLRLEAGLCLYGHELDESISPVEAGLAWAMQKRRRTEGGFLGAEVILRQLETGPPRRRVGIRPESRAPVRDGAMLLTPAGTEVGVVTSGGYGPTVEAPVAMGYVTTDPSPDDLTRPGTSLIAVARGKEVACRVASLPFVEPNYHREIPR